MGAFFKFGGMHFSGLGSCFFRFGGRVVAFPRKIFYTFICLFQDWGNAFSGFAFCFFKFRGHIAVCRKEMLYILMGALFKFGGVLFQVWGNPFSSLRVALLFFIRKYSTF